MNDSIAILNQRPATSDQNSVLVSIIIPAYNTTKYIHRAIESSIRQTHSNVEIIIIDDGSNDDTLKISQAYAEKDSRIKVIHQENNGVSSARNHGMREANGEYYVFLDSDDWLEDDAVEVLLDAQIKHPDKLIAGTYYLVNEKYQKKPERTIPAQAMTIKDVAESFCLIGVLPYGFGFDSCWAKIYRADICRQAINFPEGIYYSEDRVFVWNYVNKIGGAFYISKYVLNVLTRSGSAIRTTDSESMRKNLYSQPAAHKIMINNPNNTPEIRNILDIGICLHMMSFTVTNALTSEENITARRYIRQYAHKLLTCRKIPLKRKFALLYRVYLPLTVSKAIFSTWKIMKKIRDKIMRK